MLYETVINNGQINPDNQQCGYRMVLDNRFNLKSEPEKSKEETQMMIAGLVRVLILLMITASVPGVYNRGSYTLEITADNHRYVDGAEVVLSEETTKLLAKHKAEPNYLLIYLDANW